MVKYVHGDLLDCSEPLIFHGCNALGVMGAGFALALKKRWPMAYTTYTRVHQRSGLKLGQVIWHKAPPYMIGHCITQQGVGHGLQIEYEALRTSVQRVMKMAEMFEFKSVGCPMIGAVLGGGDWNLIADILAEESVKAGIGINVYILDKEIYQRTIKGRQLE